MVIRIRGKHFVYASTVLLVLILVITNFGGDLLYQYANVLNKLGYTEKANVYYSRISDYYAQDNSAVLAEYRRIQNILIEGNFNYSTSFTVISAGMTSNSGYVGYKTVDNVNTQYEKLKMNKKANRKVMDRYTMAVALVNWFGGRSSRAIDMLEAFTPQERKLEELGKLHLSNMYFYLGDTGKSQQVITEMDPLEELQGYQEDILVLNQLFEHGEEVSFEEVIHYEYNPDRVDCLEEPLKYARSLVKALESFLVQQPASTDEKENIEERDFTEFKSQISGQQRNKDGINEKSSEIAERNEVEKARIIEDDISQRMKRTGTNTLSGRITLDGLPQPNMMVFIQNAEYKNSWSSTISPHFGLTCLGISDAKGYFEIPNIPDGVYGIVMYIPWQRITGKNVIYHSDFDIVLNGNTTRHEDITLSEPFQLEVLQDDDTVTFQWDDHEMAAGLYSLAISELTESDGMLYRSNNTYYISRISGNELSLNITDAQKKAYRLGFSYGTELDPREYFEPLYHSGQYGYVLSSAQWSEMIHVTSEGIYANQPPARITIQGSEWTPEDLLLLDGKFDEARMAYETLLEKEPENIHALKVLSRMYGFGYIAPEGEDYYNLGGRNETRALALLQRLDTLVDSNDIKNALANQYRQLKQYQEAAELYILLQNRNPNPYTLLEIGRLHLYMNQYFESVNYFKKYESQTGDGTLDLFLPAILMNDIELLTEGASQYKTIVYTDICDLVGRYIQMDRKAYQDFFELVRQGQIEEAQKWLDGRNGEMDVFLKAVFQLTQDRYDISYEEKDAAFRAYHQQVQNPVLDELLVYLGREFVSSAYRTPLE